MTIGDPIINKGGAMEQVEVNLVKARVVSERLGMAMSQVYRLARCGAIPSYCVGEKKSGVRFDISEVKEALRRPVVQQSGEVK
jgi:predicted DNA-binding transcriptional regulator AlpA